MTDQMTNSDDKPTCPKVERYLSLRLNNPNMGTREAARLAGYAHGVPPPHARRLLKKARELRGRGEEMEDMLRKNLAYHRRQAREMAEWAQLYRYQPIYQTQK